MPLPSIVIETAVDPTFAVIWLHGLGADGHDFEPIVPELVDKSWPSLRFVFPNAPVRPITINGGMPMRGWYDISGMEIAQKQDEVGIRDSIRLLDALIDEEIARGIPSANIVLAGFSQGGAIVLSGGIRSKHKLCGIVALSTYLPIAEKTDAEASDANRDTPIFMAHGMLDPTISHALGEMSREYLKQRRFHVDWHPYPMAHQICAEEISDLKRWLGARLR